jgi:hypothetical protein
MKGIAHIRSSRWLGEEGARAGRGGGLGLSKIPTDVPNSPSAPILFSSSYAATDLIEMAESAVSLVTGYRSCSRSS